ncbi:hypothetical protein Poli38472_003673 [Pythium oligandrum]|uniref:EGF-like domain-containing protein n=1 Tax=Pythium oligandrum TaxID=41045 RepID=A0A8K1FPS4_PYTOL|nr:hypothetical protein Poli38472_003673 [Pythium oligandrum]|eukprot:TMW65908.1 hypothetical protein Poli38472_003673 [Pythium oligandrum]
MKVLYVAYATALASLVRGDTVSTTYPGRCLATKDCAVYGSGLECIAVDSNTKGLEKLSMCIPSGSICSGQIAGSCPTFSSWPATYRKVMTVCAFTVVENCDKQIAVTVKQTTTGSGSGQTTGEGEITVGDSSGSSSNTTVECYKRTFTANNENKTVNGIYKCLDARKYIQENLGHITNLTNSHIISCGGDPTSTTPKLCSGQGTCSPKTAFVQEYECKCNAGYSGTLCANVTSNVCSNLGQCGSSGTCVLTAGQTSGTCTCKAGSTGNQCSSCDASSSSACNGNGKCDSGVCSCNSGYSGTLCADRTSTGGTTDSASSLFTMVTATLSTMAAIGVMIFA